MLALAMIDLRIQMVSNVTIMPSSSQVLQLENFLPYRLSILAQIVSESLHDLYAGPFDLAVTEWRVMAALGRFAPLTASEVGKRIVMDKVAVSRAVAGLLKRGLVERGADRTDRRRALLRLSARGRAMHARIVPLALEYEARLYAALNAAERRQFAALSDRLFIHAQTLRQSR
jgi:DNA-binding MarR family transcriptional regulator